MIAVASQNEIPTKSFVAKAILPPASAALAEPATKVRRIVRDALKKLFSFNILLSLENVINLCTYDAAGFTD